MSGIRIIPPASGEFVEERDGFVWQWCRWIPEANFSHLLQQNASSAITNYLTQRNEWTREHAAGGAFEAGYQRHHLHGRHHYPQLRHDNRTWPQVIGGFFGNIAREWGWTSQPPASGGEGSPYGHHVYSPQGTTHYAPPMTNAGFLGGWTPWVLAGGGLLGITLVSVYNRSASGDVAGAVAREDRDLELGANAPFLAGLPSGGEIEAPWLPVMQPQLSASSPELTSQPASLRRSQSALF